MSKNITMEDLIPKEEVTPTSEETTEEIVVEETTETEPTDEEQDLLKKELERVQKSGIRTEREKAEFSLSKNAERVKELGGDPASILGIEIPVKKVDTEDLSEDDKPVTIGMLRKIQLENVGKTALQKAEEITNVTERELVKFHIENTIKSTGNPDEDLRIARAIVNAVKNTQIIEETTRKSQPKTHSNASGVDAKVTQVQGELTAAEKQFLGKPFNLTKEQIIASRPK
jgi:hypothetical protein